MWESNRFTITRMMILSRCECHRHENERPRGYVLEHDPREQHASSAFSVRPRGYVPERDPREQRASSPSSVHTCCASYCV